MDAYSDGINKDSSQYAIRVGKVDGNHSKQKIHQTKNVPVSCIGDFKNMPKDMLIKNLKLFQLSTNGSRKVLSKRLEMYDKKTTQMFDYYVVIDYEATCDENHKNFDKNNQEIIEFPAVLLNCHTGEVEAEFQSYCRPVINPLLTKYCTKLTGITQNIVDKSPSFGEVFASFEKWLQKKKLGSEYSFAILTDGSKDSGHFLKRQCVLSQIDFPEYSKYWINLRKSFTNFYQTRELQHLARLANDTVLNIMIKEIGYKFQGKPHSGLDDARNIAFVAQCLLQDGASLVFNEKLPDHENAGKKENSFSTPVSKEEFLIICGTLKSNFPAKKSPPVSSKNPDTDTVAKDVLVKACKSEIKEKPLVKEVAKISAIASNSAKGASKKTTAKKNLHSTKDTVKIPTKENQAKQQNSLMKTKAITKSTSEKTSANVTPTQSSVKKPSGKSTAKILETSAQNTKTANVIKQELMFAKKVLYANSEHIPFKKMKQLKEHIEDLKKSLKAARSREEKAVVVTKLDLSGKKDSKVPEATSTNRGFAALNENRIIGIFASSKAEKERLFFEDFENLLTMNNNS